MELNLTGADIHNVEVPIILRDQVLGTIQLEFTGKQPGPDEFATGGFHCYSNGTCTG